MVCENCGTVYYSAAARTMVAAGERCEKCGGRLVLAEAPRPARGAVWRRGPERAGGGPAGGPAGSAA
jgi:DNA-directed RNA polymerase subunit RPC12/RpoP